MFPTDCPGAVGLDDFAVNNVQMLGEPLLFEMHSHSVHSDGFLTPSALVERAHRNGVSGWGFLVYIYLYSLRSYL